MSSQYPSEYGHIPIYLSLLRRLAIQSHPQSDHVLLQEITSNCTPMSADLIPNPRGRNTLPFKGKKLALDLVPGGQHYFSCHRPFGPPTSEPRTLVGKELVYTTVIVTDGNKNINHNIFYINQQQMKEKTQDKNVRAARTSKHQPIDNTTGLQTRVSNNTLRVYVG